MQSAYGFVQRSEARLIHNAYYVRCTNFGAAGHETTFKFPAFPPWLNLIDSYKTSRLLLKSSQTVSKDQIASLMRKRLMILRRRENVPLKKGETVEVTFRLDGICH